MRTFDQASFDALINESSTAKKSLKKDLKFVTSTEKLLGDWSQQEMVAVSNKEGDKGVLLLQPEDDLFIIQYDLVQRIIDSSTGRDRAIVCDFCFTWQPGSNAARITFSQNAKHSVGFLCCADLRCSDHVRTMTKASVMSRAQFRESLTNEDRIARLKNRLQLKVQQLHIEAVDTVPE